MSGLLGEHYSNSPFNAVKDVHPEIREWEMKTTPSGFFEDCENRIASTFWLIKKLGKDPRDITVADFKDNRLLGLLGHYSSSPFKAVNEVHPEINEWEMAVTPYGFFEDPKKRTEAIVWLISKLKKDPRDITQADFLDNRLSGLLGEHYSNSPFKAVKDVHPEIREWEMKNTPSGFFLDRKNRKDAIEWLIKKTNKGPRDISELDFLNNRLGGLLVDYYSSSPFKAVLEVHPEINAWEMWVNPNGLFQKQSNRIDAVKWLAKKLGKDPRDLTTKDFYGNRLQGLLCDFYSNSPFKAVREAYPEIQPEEMSHKPKDQTIQEEMLAGAKRMDWKGRKQEARHHHPEKSRLLRGFF